MNNPYIPVNYEVDYYLVRIKSVLRLQTRMADYGYVLYPCDVEDLSYLRQQLEEARA
jgi:hypothetical protein